MFSRGKNVLYVYTFLLFALDGVHQLEQCEEDEVFYSLQNQKRECIKYTDDQLRVNLSQRLKLLN